jgi:hypothetical protein
MNREKEVFSDEKQIFNNDFFQKALKWKIRWSFKISNQIKNIGSAFVGIDKSELKSRYPTESIGKWIMEFESMTELVKLSIIEIEKGGNK